MILLPGDLILISWGKPRASGDDPTDATFYLHDLR